jgi:hypothetical protein
MAFRALCFLCLGFLLGVAGSAGSGYLQRTTAPDVLVAAPDHYQLEFENEFVLSFAASSDLTLKRLCIAILSLAVCW